MTRSTIFGKPWMESVWPFAVLRITSLLLASILLLIGSLANAQTAAIVSITQQPADQTVFEGENASFSITASGEGNLTYQWFVNDVAIPNAIDSLLSLNAVTISDNGTNYSVEVSDSGSSVTSESATLTVEAIEPEIILSINQQPANQTVFEGENASFSVTASGEGNLTYQWFANDVAIANATDNTLSLNTLAISDTGTNYSVEVSDSSGSVTSESATLTVEAVEPEVILSISQQPADQTVSEGENVSFSVTASGEGNLTYQWFANDVAIPNAINSLLSLNAVAISDNGTNYSVDVTDSSGSVTSESAILTVEAVEPEVILSISQQPADQTVSEGESASFSVTASGEGNLTYQWFANDVAIANATDNTLSLNTLAISDTGTNYSVEVSDSSGSVTSESATLTVEAVEPEVILSISQQPADQTVSEGENVSFSVSASGEGNLTYQWFANDVAIPNAIDSLLSLNAVAISDNGTNYSVEVSDSSGSVTSESATLTVEAVEPEVILSISQQPADQTVFEGENASFSVTASGEGNLTYQWLANDRAIANANDSLLSLNAVTISDNGTNYSVEVSDSSGSVISESATLTVEAIEPEVILSISQQPANQTVSEGENASFSVTASGEGNLTYQWFVNDVVIPNANDSLLSLNAVAISDNGTNYSVEVTDSRGSVISEPATLTVNESSSPVTMATIGTGTVDSSRVAGPRFVRLEFDSFAAGEHTITVTWDSDADVRFIVNESDGTNISSTIRGLNPGIWTGVLEADSAYFIGLWSANGAANYTATIETNSEPDNEPANNVPLAISNEPSDLVVTEGNDAEFFVEATGSGTLRYQWSVNGTAITGATSSSFSLGAVTLAENGNVYLVEVSDEVSNVLSASATLTVNMNESPSPGTIVDIGQGTLDSTRNAAPRFVRLDFNSLASAEHTITVNWDSDADVRFIVNELDGTDVSATIRGSNPGTWTGVLEANTAYFLGLWSRSGIANYTVTLETNAETIEEPDEEPNEEGPLEITDQPADLTVIEGENAEFTVQAVGTGVINYQWSLNDEEIADATNNILTITDVVLNDAGTYVVVVEDDSGFFTASSAQLTVTEALPLEITSQPTDLVVTEGSDATFEVQATGNGGLEYQWFANDEAIPGATDSSYTLAAVELSASGITYTVDISDASGAITTSNAVSLTVEQENSVPVTVITLGQGTLDSSRNTGPRFVRLDFESLAAAEHTVTVTWDSDADVRFRVNESDGTDVSPIIRGGESSGTWTGALEVNTAYFIGLWSTNGIANYTATIETSAEANTEPNEEMPLEIISQPADVTVAAGDDAEFFVEAVGSGSLSYLWFIDGVLIADETTNTLIVPETSVADDSLQFSVEVSNGTETLSSSVATLTVTDPEDGVLLSDVAGRYSLDADVNTWILDGRARTLDFNGAQPSLSWGRVLLRIGDVLLVGGDFEGIRATPDDPVTARPWLAAFNAIDGQPMSTFQVPPEVDGVVRSLVLSPGGDKVYVGGDFGFLAIDAQTGAWILLQTSEKERIPGVYSISR